MVNQKREMEKIIHQIAGKNDSIKIIRPPAVFGPRETDIYTIFKTMKLRIFPMVGDGIIQKFQWYIFQILLME